ncbi:hypothetical protein EXIGLDRAFT_842051 [Exidia glandulosa HHB12029]|uniref:Alpha-ketoglutarate-dependent dioxygenase AlkB-like domain-containing protein n=1 Tax=Exidia glandulosa HHB12029 TaxID=1314781 RepID=A0A165DID1_EXIGL|nr:hypothetical protein EXIGLDRAFT_842051 [Exidia glandulosa HHB12029]
MSRTLENWRLQIWGGIIKNGVLVGQKLPDWLDRFPDLVTRLRDTGAFKSAKHGQPNHVIVNEYLAGQGLMPHEDGPAYQPVVGTISLGSHAVFNYYKYADASTDDNASTRHRTTTTQAAQSTVHPSSRSSSNRAVSSSPAHRSTPDISTASRSVRRTFSVGTTA